MQSLIISFLSGYFISLSGSIAPSNMSATTMALTVEKNKRAGLLFGLGSAIVEAVYIRLYFHGFDMFLKQGTLFLILQWVMLVIFLVIGLVMFIRHGKKQLAKNPAPKKDYSNYSLTKAFLMGVMIKALNPLQFVFWTFWSSYLISNNWLEATNAHYNFFCVALGLGTYSGFVLYVFLGRYLASRSFFSKNIFRRMVGGFLCLTSIAWAIKLVFSPVGNMV
jgi:threonine/homoserine/homoserine lactone efflux protein